MNESDRSHMIAVFRRLALLAGAKIMEIYDRDDFDVREKADESPVTEADEAADRLIADGLREAFSDISLVTEEQAHTHSISDETFLIVDPLDGTKEFVKRRGDFTVNIALVEDGVPTIGAVYAPAKRRLFLAMPDGTAVEETGALDPENQGPTVTITVAKPLDALRVVASKSHRDAATDDYIGRYSVCDLVSAGSSMKFCLVATGEADFYPRLGPTMEWDTAAGHAVLRAAGGEVVDRETKEPLRYGKPEYRNPHFLAYAPGVTLVDE